MKVQARFSTFKILFWMVLALSPISASLGQVTLGPGLTEALATMAPTDRLIVLLTYDQTAPLNQEQVNAVSALGITQGLFFESLPIMAVLADPEQILSLKWHSGVRSVWMNQGLVTYNEEARAVTGVGRVQSEAFALETGLDLTGEGTTVLINDSGLDTTHPDLPYGTTVVENVQALTNLQAVLGILPATYLEGQVISDLLSGHGTHVAGTIAGSGARSQGRFRGVAPGADLVGYGSSLGVTILDALGGFDYAITHQHSFSAPIRVINNSWGNPGTFDASDPVNVASYAAYLKGINVVFAAGNNGSGEGTHNRYSQAPWVISVAAGTKQGALADFSSRGVRGETGNFSMPDGSNWTYINEPTITAPGVDVVSTRALTNLLANGGAQDLEVLGPVLALSYTILSGTSMAAPHVSGIIALILQANPDLNPDQVRQVLMESATNLGGREPWEAGAGYVNAPSAIMAALGRLPDWRRTVNMYRSWNSGAQVTEGSPLPFSLDFGLLGSEVMTFQADADTAWVFASGDAGLQTVALVLTDPAGNEYGSAIGLPFIEQQIGVSAPGMPGTWKLTVRGIGAIADLRLDPLGLTQGISLPGTVNGFIHLTHIEGFQGLDDLAGHPAADAIRYAVSRHLVDGRADAKFHPDDPLTRFELADYLVMGAGIRQNRPFLTATPFSDLTTAQQACVAAVTVTGCSLKDRDWVFAAVLPGNGTQFNPNGTVSRRDLAYALVQNLGLQTEARSFTGPILVEHEGQALQLKDAGQIPASMKGYVQLALSLGLMQADIVMERQGLLPLYVARAYFHPNQAVTRSEYAVIATRYLDAYP